MTNTFAKRGNDWVVVSSEYHRSGDRVEVAKKGGTTTVTLGAMLEKPQGVQRRGDYVYTIQR